MPRLTDKQRKMVIADYVDGISQRELAKKYNTSVTTIKKTLARDPEVNQKIVKKKEENLESVMEYMASKKGEVCNLIGKFLAAMNDPAKYESANIVQLATAMGIVIDKYTDNEARSIIATVHIAEDDPITKSLKEEFKEK